MGYALATCFHHFMPKVRAPAADAQNPSTTWYLGGLLSPAGVKRVSRDPQEPFLPSPAAQASWGLFRTYMLIQFLRLCYSLWTNRNKCFGQFIFSTRQKAEKPQRKKVEAEHQHIISFPSFPGTPCNVHSYAFTLESISSPCLRFRSNSRLG